jgi:hypothetical protein
VHLSNGSGGNQQGVWGSMNQLAWNCQGSGGKLVSSKMLHLLRLVTSTQAKLIFISETRNSTITKHSLINRFNMEDAHIVPSQGISGGLWFLWHHEVKVSVESSSQNLILASCTYKQTMFKFGLICMYGDPYHQNTSTIWATVQAFVVNYHGHGMPMLCIGDLNNIMSASEKHGPLPANLNRISNFCCMVKNCGFFDLGYNGPAYTWTNKRFTTNPTYQRLDRCLANAEWCSAFPTTSIYHLPMMRSDHSPILAVLESNRTKTRKPFRFENYWLLEQDFKQVAQRSWSRSQRRPFHQKLSYLASDIKVWRKSKPKLTDHLQDIENQLLQHQSRPPHLQNQSAQSELILQHHNILAKQDVYHRQRYKKIWALKGGRNTAFSISLLLKELAKIISPILLIRMVLLLPHHTKLSPLCTHILLTCSKRGFTPPTITEELPHTVGYPMIN